MKIRAINRQHACPVNLPAIRQLVAAFMLRSRHLAPEAAWTEITFILVDDAGITPVNRRHLGKDRATDVISFRYPPLPGEPGAMTGEVFINAERAVRLTAGRNRRGWSRAQELALYIAHGCDHLADQSDYEEVGRQRMRRRELGWLRDPAVRLLVARLCRP